MDFVSRDVPKEDVDKSKYSTDRRRPTNDKNCSNNRIKTLERS